MSVSLSIFEGCTDYCGWFAGMIAAFSFGSFGVPIKASGAQIEYHPLVMQSYKTLTCFATCWLVIFLGVEVRWTPWGIVSGLFWVPGASCGIYAIRNAGLAIAVGTWSSIIVLSSFVWGIIVFQEGVKDITQAGCAFLLLVFGLIGMSKYSKPATAAKFSTKPQMMTSPKSLDHDENSMGSSDGSEEGRISKRKLADKDFPSSSSSLNITTSALHVATTGMSSLSVEPLLADTIDVGAKKSSDKDGSDKDRIVFCGGRLVLSRRQLGILGAVINGGWGGLNLIPMHFVSSQGFGGANYLISYASGSLIVNTLIWIGLFLYHLHQKKGNVSEAVESLPKWHLEQLGIPGFCAGLLYSLGNFSSILAVTYLGQGIGFSMCQCSLLVSGLWGILYFREIEGRATIMKWFGAAVLTFIGILWLSYEHEGSQGAHR